MKHPSLLANEKKIGYCVPTKGSVIKIMFVFYIHPCILSYPKKELFALKVISVKISCCLKKLVILVKQYTFLII